MNFRSGDGDGDEELDFDEFVAMLPEPSRKRHTRAQIRDWFDTMDVDKSGKISMQEFFLFSAQAAAWRSGAGLATVFKKYDRDGSGTMDEMEFTSAIMGMGFGDIAASLFKDLDVDKDRKSVV